MEASLRAIDCGVLYTFLKTILMNITGSGPLMRGDSVLADASALFSTPAGHAAMMKWYAQSLAHSNIEYESITLATRHGETHLMAAGPKEAQPVILLHGMEGNAASWRHQLVGLGGDLRLYALDIIGSAGKSAPTRLAHDNHDYAEWLVDVMTGLGLERASLVGVSNGSWLILKLAAYEPARIAKAVLMSANGLVPVRFPYNLVRMIDHPAVRAAKDVLAAATLTRGLVRAAIKSAAMADVDLDPEEVEWFYLLAKHYRFRFPPGPVSDMELAALSAPTLLMMGEHEQFFHVESAIARARQLVPNLVSAEIVPKVTHNMCTDNPALINERLRTFLS